MNCAKPFKTHDEQLNILESRGIDFSKPSSKSNAKKWLQRIGYYNLINGYSSPFWDTSDKDKYLQGTTIDEIYSLYLFDRKMRQIFLKHILPLETNVKSLVAYYFPMAHPEANYLVYENFDTSSKNCSKHIIELIAEIQRQIASRVSDPSISHYLNKYGYVPLWVLNNILTLGTISKFYSLMKQEERQKISKVFHLSDNELESVLTYVSSVRNFCAHGNRLFCFRSKRPLCDTKIHQKMNIVKSESGEYLNGKRDLFAVLIALKLTLSKTEFKEVVKDVETELNALSKKLHTINITTILEMMGFPTDWKKKLLVK